ncbi:hypothetical protein, partial [Plasmodium yoelii yoelii]
FYNIKLQILNSIFNKYIKIILS